MKDKYDVSVIAASIKPDVWVKSYESIKESFGDDITFEMIFISPYLPPADFDKIPNKKYLMDKSPVTRCFQQAAILAEGRYLTVSVDDGHWVKGEQGILLKQVRDMNNPKAIGICKYVEGENLYGPSHHRHFGHHTWFAGHSSDFQAKVINPNWVLGLQIIFPREYLIELGGWDCEYEYPNFGGHDLLFRAQMDGAPIKLSDRFVLYIDFTEGRDKDVDPVIGSQEYHDRDLFKSKHFSDAYSKEHGLRSIKIDINNWKQASNVWERRWGKKS